MAHARAVLSALASVCYDHNGPYPVRNCHACSAGRYRGAQAYRDCKACPAGYYQDGVGKQGCKACSVGTYQDSEGEQGCNACEACETSVQGANYCFACEPGMYQDQAEFDANAPYAPCKKCPDGKYSSDSNQNSCDWCPDPYYPRDPVPDPPYPEPHWKVDVQHKNICWRCAAGTVRDKMDLDTNNPHSYECLACPLGWYQTADNQKSCVAGAHACVAGEYAAGIEPCHAAPPCHAAAPRHATRHLAMQHRALRRTPTIPYHMTPHRTAPHSVGAGSARTVQRGREYMVL